VYHHGSILRLMWWLNVMEKNLL